MPDALTRRVKQIHKMSQTIWTGLLDEWPLPDCFMVDLGKKAAYALFKENVLFFDRTLYHKNHEPFLFDTVGHEIGHLIAYRLYGEVAIKNPHGKAWREVMYILGLPANTYHNYNTSHVLKDGEYFCLCGKKTCSNCKKTVDIFKSCVKVGS